MAAKLPKDQFELARQRAAQRASQQASEAKGALQRRFAQLGTLQGGERLKLEQQAEEQSNQLRQEAEESIQAAEVAEAQRKQEIKEGREFQTSERVGSQDFAAKMQQEGFGFARGEREASQKYETGEREASQAYGTKERIAGQEFVASEALKNRDFTTAERQATEKFAADQAENDRLFNAGENQKARELQTKLVGDQIAFEKEKLGAQVLQFQETLEEERRVNTYNIELADKISNEKGFFDSITSGAGGFRPDKSLTKVTDNLGDWFRKTFGLPKKFGRF